MVDKNKEKIVKKSVKAKEKATKKTSKNALKAKKIDNQPMFPNQIKGN